VHRHKDQEAAMEKIEIPVQHIVSLDAVATRVVGLRMAFVNVFAVAGESRWTLIHCGPNGAAGWITDWVQPRG
jgi:hypothetical protein